MTTFKCHNCGLVNNAIEGDDCRRCGTTHDPNASPYRSTYTPPASIQQQPPMYQQQFSPAHTPISGAETLLWALCCFPIGFARFNQLGKFLIWLLIVVVTGGIGLIPMYIDYVMSYGAQQTRPLKPWEFFPRQ